eukprot:s1482_g5.t1
MDGATPSSKRPVADPEGPILELLRVYKIQNAPSYYDSRIRGKVQRLDKPRIAPHLSQKSKSSGAPRPPKEARKGKEVWNFKDEDFEPLRHLWREPPKLQGLARADAATESLFASIDLHGACVEVVASKQPNLLRLKGTVIEETQRTAMVKMIPKDPCVFEVELPEGLRLRFLGPCHGRPLPSPTYRKAAAQKQLEALHGSRAQDAGSYYQGLVTASSERTDEAAKKDLRAMDQTLDV